MTHRIRHHVLSVVLEPLHVFLDVARALVLSRSSALASSFVLVTSVLSFPVVSVSDVPLPFMASLPSDTMPTAWADDTSE